MKNIKRITLPLALPLLLSISSCDIRFSGNRSAYPDDRAVSYSLASADREDMEEAYAAFFKETFECDKMHVRIEFGEGEVCDYSEQDISGTSSHYASFEAKSTGFCDAYYYEEIAGTWAFIDGDGNKIYANAMDEGKEGLEYHSFIRNERYYEDGLKLYKWDMNLLGYLQDVDAVYNVNDPRVPGAFDNAVYKTFFSEPKDGVSDILLTVTVKDKNGNDLEAVHLQATSKNGLVSNVKYSYWGFHRYIENDSLVDESFYDKQTHTLFFSYPETVNVDIPDISGWEDVTDMKD